MKKLLVLAAALGLAACQPGPVLGAGSEPPAAVTVAANVADAVAKPPSQVSPTSNSIIDEKAVLLLADAADLARIGVDGLILAKRITPGSPAAVQVAGYLRDIRDGLRAARNAQAALQAKSYNEAVNRGWAALKAAKAILAANTGEVR